MNANEPSKLILPPTADNTLLNLDTPLSDYLLQQLKLRLTMKVEDFKALGDVKDTADGPVIHIDNGGSVLGVAHLDWVLYREPTISKNKHKVFCPQLDDRLGVWVILDLLPTLYGIKYDVLLTDSEECGRSTAKDFTNPPKDYNWMFQFDRRGSDTVLYRYDSPENRKRLEGFGLKTGTGTYSDICKLDHLGVSGWNIGTGYFQEHSQACNADLKITRGNAHKFKDFFLAHKDEKIASPPYTERTYGGYYSSSRYTSAYSGWDFADDYAEYYDSPEYKLHKKQIIKAFSDPTRRFDEDWRCECGKVNFWDVEYCADCGEWFDPDIRYGDVDIIDLDSIEPFHSDDDTQIDDDDLLYLSDKTVSIDDWDQDRETYGQFCLRTGYAPFDDDDLED